MSSCAGSRAADLTDRVGLVNKRAWILSEPFFSDARVVLAKAVKTRAAVTVVAKAESRPPHSGEKTQSGSLSQHRRRPLRSPCLDSW